MWKWCISTTIIMFCLNQLTTIFNDFEMSVRHTTLRVSSAVDENKICG